MSNPNRKYANCNCPHGYSYGCPTCPPEEMMIVLDRDEKPKTLGQVAFEAYWEGSQRPIDKAWALGGEQQHWERAAQAVYDAAFAEIRRACYSDAFANEVKAEGVVEERERCAAVVEGRGFKWLSELLRARGKP